MYIIVCLYAARCSPRRTVGSATGIPAAVQAVISSAVGSGAAKDIGLFLGVVLILQYLSSASVWTLGSARVQAVAALDGSAPRLLGKFSKQGTPLPMCILMGIVGSYVRDHLS